MRRQLMKVGVAALALVAGLAVPAFAQDSTGDVAVGLSFLGDEGGLGVQGSLSNQIKDLDNGKTLSWVADASFHHKSFDLTDVSWSTFMVQGGARVRGTINDKTAWFGQGLIGIRHATFSSDLTDSLCSALEIDCDASDTGVIVTPGGGIDYAINDKMSARAQLDIPIGSGGSTTRFFVGLAWKR